MLRRRGRGGEQRDRLEMRHVLRPAAQRFQVAVARRHRVRHEHEIEAGALGGLRQIQEIGKVLSGVDLRLGVKPRGDVLPHRREVGAEMDLTCRAHPVSSAGRSAESAAALRAEP